MLDEGKKFDLKLAGAYAMDSLRLEKGYRHWSHELDSETSPVEARLMHAVDLNKVQLKTGRGTCGHNQPSFHAL